MEQRSGKVHLSRYLSRRLIPLTWGVGVLISLGLPTVYYALERNALTRDAATHALKFAEQFQGVVLADRALREYHTYQYQRLLRDLLHQTNIVSIRVLDEAGRSVREYEYASQEVKS